MAANASGAVPETGKQEPPAPKMRPLSIKLFQKERLLGELPTTIHTDVRSVVTGLEREANGRGRPVVLPAARLDAVEVALRAGGVFDSIASLRAAVVGWRHAARAKVDAPAINAYYDEWRTVGYTQSQTVAQETLTMRCAEIGGLLSSADGTAGKASGMAADSAPAGDVAAEGAQTDGTHSATSMPDRLHSTSSLFIDVGCGSGLSCLPLVSRGCSVLGIEDRKSVV